VTRYEKRVAKLRKEYEAKVKAREAKAKKAKDTTKADDKAVE
jgi:hypothetical protein